MPLTALAILTAVGIGLLAVALVLAGSRLFVGWRP